MTTRLTPTTLLWCLVTLTLALLPHAGRFSGWLLAVFAMLVSWRWLGAISRVPLPTREHLVLWIFKHVLALAAFLVIYIHYRGQIGRDAGLALLTALLGLKVLELESERDVYVLSFLAYFLVVTNFFYSQSVPTALYMLAVVIAITASLVRFNSTLETFSHFACLRLAGTMVAQATPLMIAAFLLFPRLPGPLWGLPQDAFSGVTGLSDTMTIGEITRLGASDEIAFRAQFDGAPPRAADLYWRGPVLWDTDGRTWRAGESGHGPTTPIIKLGPVYAYTVLLEPHGERWLLGLDAVTNVGDTAQAHADLSLVARNPVKKRLRYRLESAPAYAARALSTAERAAALALPYARHPKALALAHQWRAADPTPAAIVARALDYYREQGFVYTLLPPALPRDSVDQFLFETHAGFCEHYAASFVVLMRAAGVPARVVTGYQGGEFNDVSDYLVIRQRDAHAWAEVYLPERGWVRVDPTAVVAPSRLSLGIDSLRTARTPLAILDRNSTAVAAWRRMAALWDAANFQWAQWVLGYSAQRQFALFSSLGFDDVDVGSLLIALTCAIAILVGALALVMFRTREVRDPLMLAYARFCGKLARVGLGRAPHEGPVAYAERVADARADLSAEVTRISRLYTGLRYAELPLSRALLERLIRNFNATRSRKRR